MSYYDSRTVDAEFDAVVEAAEEALADEGFGILCDIDVREKFVEKLDVDDYRQYRILGACNPPLAKETLEEEIGLGVLLPCNVVVYEDDDAVTVAAVDANAMLSVVDNPALDEVADDVNERYARVLETVAGRF